MRLRAAVPMVMAIAALCASGCDSPMCMGESCKLPDNPPQVFLVAPLTNVYGRSFKVTVNVSGCAVVNQIQLEQNSVQFKTAAFKGANTEITILPGEVARFYGTLGIAADLTIRARAICDDGRENRSPPVGIKFFPVDSVLSPPGGGIVLPDSFVAEGGLNGKPVTFIGCANVGGSLALVRVDQMGNVVSLNASLPFGCDYYATIFDKTPSTGTRWLYQPGKGAFAFDSSGLQGQDLNITGGVLGDSFAAFGVGPDGHGLIWDAQASTAPAFAKIRYNQGTAYPLNTQWVSMVPGIVNGTPVVDGTGLVMVPSWRAALGSRSGTQTIQYVAYGAGGSPTGELQLVTQTFEFLDPQNPPQVAFSPDTRTIYIAFPILGSSGQSGVMACGTQGGGAGCTPRWRSPALDGVIQYLIAFGGGTKVAAISANKVWFLEESTLPSAGSIMNPGGLPTAVSGQLTISGLQPGLGSDFYVLGGTPFATEIIAFDTPSNGEVWRYSTEGGGNTPQTSITMAIDEGGGSWLRIGVDQVRPLSLTEYRNVRGATMP